MGSKSAVGILSHGNNLNINADKKVAVFLDFCNCFIGNIERKGVRIADFEINSVHFVADRSDFAGVFGRVFLQTVAVNESVKAVLSGGVLIEVEHRWAFHFLNELFAVRLIGYCACAVKNERQIVNPFKGAALKKLYQAENYLISLLLV